MNYADIALFIREERAADVAREVIRMRPDCHHAKITFVVRQHGLPQRGYEVALFDQNNKFLTYIMEN